MKEDELMSRLEMLENQLQVYSRASSCNDNRYILVAGSCYLPCQQNASDDELKKQLAKAFEEKHKNELASKVCEDNGH